MIHKLISVSSFAEYERGDTSAGSGGFTVCAEQALVLHQQADGVQLPEEARVTEAVPQLDDEAADQRRQLQRKTEPSLRRWPGGG